MSPRTAPVPAAVNRVAAVGVETAAGTAAAITKRFASFGLTKSPQYNIGTVRPTGSKYATKHYLSGEWAEHSIEEGVMSFDEIVYPLAGALRKTAPVLAPGGTLSREWVFDSNPFARDDVQTFTVESGIKSGRGGQGPYGVFTEWGFSVARNAETSEMSGSMISRAIEQAAMSSVQPEDFVPITPAQFNLYIDTSFAALGTTQIENAFSFGFTLGDRQNPAWFLNRAINSYTATVEGPPSAEISLVVADENNPVDSILQSLRVGERIFMRLEAIGPEIEMSTDVTPVSIPYSFTADFACQVSDSPEDSDEEEMATVELTLGAEHSAELGAPFRVTVVNDITAL